MSQSYISWIGHSGINAQQKLLFSLSLWFWRHLFVSCKQINPFNCHCLVFSVEQISGEERKLHHIVRPESMTSRYDIHVFEFFFLLQTIRSAVLLQDKGAVFLLCSSLRFLFLKLDLYCCAAATQCFPPQPDMHRHIWNQMLRWPKSTVIGRLACKGLDLVYIFVYLSLSP